MPVSIVTQFLENVEDKRERRSLRNSVNYRRGLGWAESDVMHWLLTGERPSMAGADSVFPVAVHSVDDISGASIDGKGFGASEALFSLWSFPVNGLSVNHSIDFGVQKSKEEPSVSLLTARAFELRDEDISREAIAAVIDELRGLQTVEIGSAAGVRIDLLGRMQSRLGYAEKGKEAGVHPDVNAVAAGSVAADGNFDVLPVSALVIKSLFIFGLVSVSTWYLIQATAPVYGLLPAVLLELMPLSFILFMRSGLLKVAFVLGFALAGVGTLRAVHVTDTAQAEASVLDSNEEYRRLRQRYQALQSEQDGLDAVKWRSRREVIRGEMAPVEARMTAIEADSVSAATASAGVVASDVQLGVRLLLYFGALVLVHILGETMRLIQFRSPGWPIPGLVRLFRI